MSHQKTQQKKHKFDILAVSQSKVLFTEKKTEIINPWGVRRPPSPLK